MVLLERGIAVVPAGQFCRTDLGSQFEMVKEERGFFRDKQGEGDRYRIKHELILQHRPRSAQGPVTRTAGRHRLTAGSKGNTEGSSPAVGLSLAPGQRLEEQKVGPSQEGCGTSRAGCDALPCCAHHLPLYRSKNH